MFHSIKATVPILCSVLLATGLMPKPSLALPPADWTGHPPTVDLVITATKVTSMNREGSRLPQAEQRCPLQNREVTYLAQKGNILCQRRLDNNTLLRRVRVDGGCVDEMVNVQTKEVLSSRPAPCICPI